MKSTVRAFVAVEIAPSIRSEARKALKPLQQAFPNVKWVDDENFHVTLKFLGPNVPTTELHHVIAAIQRACEKFEQFDLVFEGMGAFPDASNPRSLWIGVTDGVSELRRLANRIDAELQKLGFPTENREFSPHLTVGRARQKDRDESQFVARSERFGRDQRDASDESSNENYGTLTRMLYDRANAFFGTSPVDSVILYSSELERNGPKYEPLAEIELSPLGSSMEEKDEGFQPEQFDDPDFKLPENEMEKRLPEKLDAKFDVEALDAEVEDELRAICGESFAKRPGQPGAKRPKPVKRPNVAPSGKKSKPKFDEPKELDSFDLDLSDFEAFRDAKR